MRRARRSTKGGYSLSRKRISPLVASPHGVGNNDAALPRCDKNPAAQEARKKAAFRLPIFLVHRAHEGRRSLLKSDIQLHAVRAHIARGVFIGMPVLGRGAALMEERGRAGRTVQKLRLVRREDDGLVGVRRGKRDHAHMVEETVKAVRFQQLARQVGVDVLGIVGRFKNEEISVVNEYCTPLRRVFGSETNVPLPRFRTTKPSSSSAPMA